MFNIPSEFKDADLEELFREFGEVISVKVGVRDRCEMQVILDRQTNVSKGYGFVNFATKEEAERAISAMNGKVIRNKKISVQIKKPRSSWSCLLYKQNTNRMDAVDPLQA